MVFKRFLIMSVIFFGLSAGLNGQIFQAGPGVSVSFAESVTARLSAEVSVSWGGFGLDALQGGSIWVFTLNTGIISSEDWSGAKFFFDGVFWYIAGFGAGLEVDFARMIAEPYVLITEIFPLFMLEGFEELPVIPVGGVKWIFGADGRIRFDLLLRLKWVFTDI